MKIELRNLEDKCQLDGISLVDADHEFVSDMNQSCDDFYRILLDKELVGCVQIVKGKKAYIYVYLDPNYRNKGIGRLALDLSEGKIDPTVTKAISTSYRMTDELAMKFARSRGYHRKFSSALMTYKGPNFELKDLEVRPYRDEDFDQVHTFYARAFHEMRLGTGDFPDSVVEKASDKIREAWLKYAHRRMVLISNNEIVAYAKWIDNEISIIVVDDKHQRKGYGRQLLKYTCNKIISQGYDSIHLWCVVGNKANILYTDLGFEVVYTSEFAEKKVV